MKNVRALREIVSTHLEGTRNQSELKCNSLRVVVKAMSNKMTLPARNCVIGKKNYNSYSYLIQDKVVESKWKRLTCHANFFSLGCNLVKNNVKSGQFLNYCCFIKNIKLSRLLIKFTFYQNQYPRPILKMPSIPDFNQNTDFSEATIRIVHRNMELNLLWIDWQFIFEKEQ